MLHLVSEAKGYLTMIPRRRNYLSNAGVSSDLNLNNLTTFFDLRLKVSIQLFAASMMGKIWTLGGGHICTTPYLNHPIL